MYKVQKPSTKAESPGGCLISGCRDQYHWTISWPIHFLSAAGHFMVEFGCSGVFWWPLIWMFQSKKMIELGRHTLLSRLRALKPGMSRRGFPGFFQHCVGFIWVGASEICARRVSIFGKSQGCICQPWSDFIRWSSIFTRTRRWVGMPLRPDPGFGIRWSKKTASTLEI